MSGAFRERLRRIVGSDGLIPLEENKCWASSDQAPGAVVCPSSTDEVAEVLALASQEGLKVVPAGQGSWLRGGNPVEADLILSVRRLKRIVEYEPADVTISVEVGLSMVELEETTLAHGQWLPLDPPGVRRGSLGGLVATGVGGPLRHSYGTPRDHLLGLTLVTGDGRVLRLGGRVVKNVAGFDLTRLCIGSWGTLGVVTTASVRLFPTPERDVSLLLEGGGAGEVLEAGRVLAGSSLIPGSLELLEGVKEVVGERAGPTLLVRLLGSALEVGEMELRIGEMVPGLSTSRFEDSESMDLHARLTGHEDDAVLVLRIAVLPSKLDSGRKVLRDFLVESGFGSEGVETATHLGSGVTRVVAKPPVGDDPSAAENGWIKAIRSLREAVELEGGSVTVSLGPPNVVREVGAWGDPGPLAKIQKNLKREFDPAGILSPGRFVI